MRRTCLFPPSGGSVWGQPPSPVPPRQRRSSRDCHSAAVLAIIGQHAQQDPLPLERDSWPSPGSLAKSVSSLAHRNLHGREDEADRLRGVLGVYVARASRTLAIPALDRRDGTLRPSQTKKPVGLNVRKPLWKAFVEGGSRKGFVNKRVRGQGLRREFLEERRFSARLARLNKGFSPRGRFMRPCPQPSPRPGEH